ncbi:MAG: hypothetical protein N4A33_10135 [Bacteriovoracaceae bacterium]|jgi:hypothetical protein|nr:hypothetical protein [Bacteriovoracaceae bacterium]
MNFNECKKLNSLFDLLLKAKIFLYLLYMILVINSIVIIVGLVRAKDTLLNYILKEDVLMLYSSQGLILFILIMILYKYTLAYYNSISIEDCKFYLLRGRKKKHIDVSLLKRIILESNRLMITFEGESRFPVAYDLKNRKKLIKAMIKSFPVLKDRFYIRTSGKDRDGILYIKKVDPLSYI